MDMMDGFHCSTIHQLNQLCYKADLVGLQHLLLVFKNLPCLQERASKMKVDETEKSSRTISKRLVSCATVQLTMFGDLNKKSQTNLSKPRFRSLFKHDNSAPSAALFACLLLPSLLSKDPDQGYPRCFKEKNLLKAAGSGISSIL